MGSMNGVWSKWKAGWTRLREFSGLTLSKKSPPPPPPPADWHTNARWASRVESGRYTSPPPAIDLQDAQSNPERSRKLIEACEEWGCFRVYNHHGILPPSLTAEMKEVERSLFDLPPETKMKIGFVPPFTGYRRTTPTNPLLESFGAHDISSPPDVEAFCAQIHASHHQRETIVKYTKAVHEMMMEIARRLCEGLGVKGELFEEWPCVLGMYKYNFTPDDIGWPGMPIHTDPGFLSLIQDDESVGGLEIMNNKSGEFVAVDPCPGTIFINIGDTAAIWSNGRFRSVKHRVMCKEARDRLSVVSGLLCHGDYVIQPPPELLEPPHLRRLYVPVTYDRLIELRQANNIHAGEVLDLLREHKSIENIITI